MSAPLRYARILNGFSSLISRRSAISRRIRAIAALSKPEAYGFDAVVEQPRASGGERLGNGVPGSGRTVAKEAASAACAAHFRGGRAGRTRARDQIIDRRRRDARREAFAVFPFGRDLPADFVPVSLFQRVPHGHC